MPKRFKSSFSNILWENLQIFFDLSNIILGELSNILWENFQLFFGKFVKSPLGELSDILGDGNVEVLLHHSMGPILLHPE